MLYADLWELVAERFHCDLNFLRELNGKTPKGELTVGSVLRVPDVVEFEIAKVAALEKQRKEEEKVKKGPREQHADSLASPSPSPSLSGEWSSVDNSRLRHRVERLRSADWNSSALNDSLSSTKVSAWLHAFRALQGHARFRFRTGNGKSPRTCLCPTSAGTSQFSKMASAATMPITSHRGRTIRSAIVWMAINKPSVGMHGTPHPDQIGRNESHGCIRMSNWDAFLLSELVEKGTIIDVK